MIDTKTYWNERYRTKRGAGSGSKGKLYEFKLRTVQRIVDEYKVKSVVDYGCGDGGQLRQLKVSSYIGLDTSDVAIKKAMLSGSGKRYDFIIDAEYPRSYHRDMSISLDVIMHLPDGEYEPYMSRLFDMSEKYVLIYAPNREQGDMKLFPHMFFRRFTDWIDEHVEAELIEHIPNEYPATVPAENVSFSEFFLYKL